MNLMLIKPSRDGVPYRTYFMVVIVYSIVCREASGKVCTWLFPRGGGDMTSLREENYPGHLGSWVVCNGHSILLGTGLYFIWVWAFTNIYCA